MLTHPSASSCPDAKRSKSERCFDPACSWWASSQYFNSMAPSRRRPRELMHDAAACRNRRHCLNLLSVGVGSRMVSAIKLFESASARNKGCIQSEPEDMERCESERVRRAPQKDEGPGRSIAGWRASAVRRWTARHPERPSSHRRTM